MWEPGRIPNPNFKVDAYALASVALIGFELWTVNPGTIFDNILVTDDLDYANARAEQLWGPLRNGEEAARDAYNKAESDKAEAAANKLDNDDQDNEDSDGDGDAGMERAPASGHPEL